MYVCMYVCMYDDRPDERHHDRASIVQQSAFVNWSKGRQGRSNRRLGGRIDALGPVKRQTNWSKRRLEWSNPGENRIGGRRGPSAPPQSRSWHMQLAYAQGARACICIASTCTRAKYHTRRECARARACLRRDSTIKSGAKGKKGG